VRALFVSLITLSLGCSHQTIPPAPDAALIDGGARDAGPFDAGSVDGGRDGGRDAGTDAGPLDAGMTCSDSCGPVELCGEDGEGTGLDEDCDDRVDEGCSCAIGTSRSCFPGPQERRDVGVCADGVMFCGELTRWGECLEGEFGGDEVCDGADNDCDGTFDDGLVGCDTALHCPGAERASPLRPHMLRGSEIDGGAGTAWRWTVTCPDTVPVCPAPVDAAARDTEILFLSSGNYRVALEVTLDDGTTNTCQWVVYVRGDGLRVELIWDTQGAGNGNTDVDLHLHRRSVAADVFDGETDWFTEDDCFYLDCKASTYDYMPEDFIGVRARWNLPDTTDLAYCENAPEGEGAMWVARGACYNPRLDVDVIQCDPAITDPTNPQFCAPENINVDDPQPGDTYRIMVHYFNDWGFDGDTHPEVNVYCFGDRRGSFGSDPFITLDYGPEDVPGREHDIWVVADVQFYIDACGRQQCRIAPLNDERNDAEFGPPWSF
jgi:hypothetical protein